MINRLKNLPDLKSDPPKKTDMEDMESLFWFLFSISVLAAFTLGFVVGRGRP